MYHKFLSHNMAKPPFTFNGVYFRMLYPIPLCMAPFILSVPTSPEAPDWHPSSCHMHRRCCLWLDVIRGPFCLAGPTCLLSLYLHSSAYPCLSLHILALLSCLVSICCMDLRLFTSFISCKGFWPSRLHCLQSDVACMCFTSRMHCQTKVVQTLRFAFWIVLSSKTRSTSSTLLPMRLEKALLHFLMSCSKSALYGPFFYS